MSRNRARQTEARTDRRTERPDIFAFHDYRAFLKEWFAFLKKLEPRFSMRLVSSEAKMGSGYLPMILAGERILTPSALAKLIPFLKLTKPEEHHLEKLVQLADSDSAKAKVVALHQMSKAPSYQKKNPAETEFITYMSSWYFVAIREMAAMPEFKPDAEWIQARLRYAVPLAEIKTALEFLLVHGYLKNNKEELVCEGSVYKPALIQYHRQMLNLAAEAIENTPAAERNLDGYTFGMSPERMEEARKIIDEAMEKLASLENKSKKPSDRVYHIEFAFFPLTKKDGGS